MGAKGASLARLKKSECRMALRDGELIISSRVIVMVTVLTLLQSNSPIGNLAIEILGRPW